LRKKCGQRKNERRVKKKIPSRKFPESTRKIPSRPFPKRKLKSKPIDEPSVTEPDTPVFEGTRQERLEALKLKLQGQLKSLQKPDC